MKFPLVALAALVATTHAFSLQGPVVGHHKLLQNQRERVVLHMDDYDDFDEEDFVDDGDITKPSWGQSASASRMGEVDVIVVEPIETVREATTVVTTDPVSSGEDPSKMRVREIKDELDSWGVDYDDCFEKTDLVKRLEQARENPGQQIGQQIRVEMSAEGRAEKEKLQSFGYVGFTEEEFFAMQSAHARQDPQRGNVVETSVNEAGSNSAGNSQKNVFLEETPEPKQHKKRTTIDSRQGNSVWMEDTPQPTQRKKKTARTIDSRKGNSVWLDDSKPSASQSTPSSGRGVQLEDVPAPKIKNGKRGPRTVEPPQAARGIRVENTPSKFEAPAYTPPPPSRKSTILLEDLPGPDDLFGFRKRPSRGPTNLPQNSASTVPQAPRVKKPTADGKGYVGMTEDEYFSERASWVSNGMQTSAPVPQKKTVPFGMTEEEFLTQQRAIGIVNEMSSNEDDDDDDAEQHFWNTRDTYNNSRSVNGGLIADELL